MKLYYHHAGILGAKEDFKKTVFSSVPISVVMNNVSDSNPHKSEMLRVLRANFPSGKFNCWGAPASNIITKLEVGDAVLLVESTGNSGRVPVLCLVVGFWKDDLRDLSRALWGNEKFRYIFFFHTEKIDLTWNELRENLGYKPNLNPRGQFCPVAASALKPL